MSSRSTDLDNPSRTSNRIHALLAGGIAVITFLFLKVCVGNQFTNWDDVSYISANSLVKDISPTGLKAIFSTPVMGNYHPLTILSYAIEYNFVQLNPWLYHFDSLVLHILVTVLVYWFVLLLSRNTIAAAITALLFGAAPHACRIHSMDIGQKGSFMRVVLRWRVHCLPILSSK